MSMMDDVWPPQDWENVVGDDGYVDGTDVVRARIVNALVAKGVHLSDDLTAAVDEITAARADFPNIDARLDQMLALLNAASGAFATLDGRLTSLEGRVTAIENSPDIPDPTSDIAIEHDLEQLTFIKAQVDGNVQPWKGMYDDMISQAVGGRASPSTTNYTPNLPTGVNNGTQRDQAVNDAHAAYGHMLHWFIEPSRTDLRDKVIAIFDGWVANFTGFNNDTSAGGYDDSKLTASWVAPNFMRAAAILEYMDQGANWTEAKSEAFKAKVYLWFMQAGKAPGSGTTDNPGGSGILNHTSGGNWNASMVNSRIDIGVYTGRAAVLENAIVEWRRLVPTLIFMPGDEDSQGYPKVAFASSNWDTPVEKARYWWFGDVKGSVANPNAAALYWAGQPFEVGRDEGHTLMGLGAMLQAACTAWLAGYDLFEDAASDASIRFRMAFEVLAGWYNEALDEYWLSGNSYPDGIDAASTGNDDLNESSWTPTGQRQSYTPSTAPDYDAPDWTDNHLGTWSGTTPQSGAIQASNFAIGGNAIDHGWEIAHYHYCVRLGYEGSMPNLVRLVKCLRGAQSTTATRTNRAGVATVRTANAMAFTALTYAADSRTPVVDEMFTRSVSSGWGTGWGTPSGGSTANYNVNGTAATIATATTANRSIDSTMTARENFDVYYSVSLSAVPNGTFFQEAVQLRKSGNQCFRLITRFYSDNTVKLQLSTVNSAGTASGTLATADLAGSYVAGDKVWVRATLKGTRLTAKAWIGPRRAEPTQPMVEYTDTLGAVPGTGTLGFWLFSNAGNNPITVTYDDLQVFEPV